MENFLENTFKNFNQSIMEIDWYSNIGNLNTNNNLILINDYLCSINKNANISFIKNWQEAAVLINSKNFDKALDSLLLQRKSKVQSNSVSVTGIIKDVKKNGDKNLDNDIWEKEEKEQKHLYKKIIKNHSEVDLIKHLSIIAQNSYKIVNRSLDNISKKNKINDQYFFKVAGGAVGLICHQKMLALFGEAEKNHMFNTKFKIFSIGNWPLTLHKNKISIF